jgi:hypothetical protein
MSTSYLTLLSRDAKNILRNPLLIKSRFFQTIFLAVYSSGVFFNITSDGNYTDDKVWSGIVGFFFFTSIASLMTTLNPMSIVFPIERAVFLKE